jgi:uncharacterized protein
MRLTLLAFLMMLCSPVAAQDFFKGYAAYEAGDYAVALKEWRPLAEAGDIGAQVVLGNMYFDGNGVNQDNAEAINWYRLAAEQGDTSTQERLGSYYLFDHHGVRDFKEAVKWLKLAAEKGNANAQFNLGIAHAKGKGATQHNVIAHMWWNISASNGHNLGGIERDNLADKMTPQAIEKAQALAAVCISSNYKKCGY